MTIVAHLCTSWRRSSYSDSLLYGFMCFNPIFVYSVYDFNTKFNNNNNKNAKLG